VDRKGNLYTFLFAGIVCVICALILSLSATALKERQNDNARLDILQNILSSVGYEMHAIQAKPAAEVFDIFAREFDTLLLDEANNPQERETLASELAKLGYPEKDLAALDTGALLARFNSKLGLLASRAGKSKTEYDPGYKVVYIHKNQAGERDAYVIPIEGNGLWDIIKGYLALDVDLNTVKGISFYEHKETPGLGARITEDWFKSQFKGKKILDEHGGLTAITVAKGKAPEGEHLVDGISGATLTGNGINQFLRADLERYEPFFKTVRAKQ